MSVLAHLTEQESEEGLDPRCQKDKEITEPTSGDDSDSQGSLWTFVCMLAARGGGEALAKVSAATLSYDSCSLSLEFVCRTSFCTKIQ